MYHLSTILFILFSADPGNDTFPKKTIRISFQLWAASTLNRNNKTFGYWIEDQQKDGVPPDSLTIIFMSHFLGRNITLISGKAEEWSTEDLTVDILLIYRGDNVYSPTDVGTYIHTKLFVNIFKFISK